MNTITAGSLFSGIGGFCLGFEKAGIETNWAVEIDSQAVETYKHNMPESVRVMNADISSISVNESNLSPVDILHAGFPCQSFSIAGEKKGFDDPRGKLFFQIIRLVNEFGDNKPSIILLENSPFIKTGNGGTWFHEIEKAIKSGGYWFKESNCIELDSYSITELPQKRKRLFMIALNIDHFPSANIEFTFPSVKKQPLSKYIDFASDNIHERYFLEASNKYAKMLEKESVGDDLNRIYQLRKYMVRVKEKNICPTLTANMGVGGHNVPFIKTSRNLFRKLTEYECAHIQGFGKDFKFPETVSHTQRYKQIGNSVSVPVSYFLAQILKNKITTDRDIGWKKNLLAL